MAVEPLAQRRCSKQMGRRSHGISPNYKTLHFRSSERRRHLESGGVLLSYGVVVSTAFQRAQLFRSEVDGN